MDNSTPIFTPLQGEIWLPMIDYEGWYEISNLGRVRRVKPSNNSKLWKTLKPHKSWNNYLTVDPCKNGIKKRYLLHILVVRTFLGEPPTAKHTDINHKNGIKWDNRLSNLEWCTRSENGKHAFAMGLNKPRKGEENNLSKLTWNEVGEIRDAFRKGIKYYVLAKKYAVNPATIYRIMQNKIWVI